MTRHYGDRTLLGIERSGKNLGSGAQGLHVGVRVHVAFHLQRTLSILKDREDVSICLKSARAIS